MAAVVATALGACSQGSSGGRAVIPNLVGPEIPAGEIPAGTEKIVAGPNGSNLRVANFGNGSDAYFLEVEGTLSYDSYTNLRAHGGLSAVKGALDQSIDAIQTGSRAIVIDRNDEVAYLSLWIPYSPDLLGALKRADFRHELYFNPVNYDTESLKQMKAYTAQSEGFTLKPIPRGGSKGYSGLERIGAVELVQKAESTIGGGLKVDGSSVRVGITDTGITYNHPTFRDANGKPRIAYMKDFTREGRVYFNPAAAFSVAKGATDDEFVVQAEAVTSVKLPELPNPAKFKNVQGLKIKASAELKAIFADPAKKVLLGYLSESTFDGDSEEADINGNGKVDDNLPILYVLGATPAEDRVYVDVSATGDFTKTKGLGDFNATGETIPAFAERIGFHIQADQLPVPGMSQPMAVRSASIVGFDPGNHGTHVGGIAAGRKTIASNSDDTLARGVAPNATILSDRVCANNGGCNASRAMIDLATEGRANVINMSLGGLDPFNDGYGVQESIVNRLTAVKNVLFVISAGNSGPGRQTLGSPSSARLSLSVGASASREMIQRQYQWPGSGASPLSIADDDFMLFFSSRGPTANGGFKPNLAAPGTELSSVQLNAAPGARSGLDVYWGTSMAAPTATGGFALLLDAIQKFNLANPLSPMTTNAQTIRQVLIATARPFGREQYSWIDEGTGMMNLPAAWDAMLKLRSEPNDSGVKDLAGKTVDLDYQVLTSLVGPNGVPYDGSRAYADDQGAKLPAFGVGLYLDANGADTLRPVYIARRLPEALAASERAGELEAQLRTTAETFALRTDFGIDEPWMKAGSLNELNCLDSDASDLQILGRGAEIVRKEDGTGTINGFNPSTLYVCLDRAKMRGLKAGDHGALIYAYRTTGSQIASIPSFVVPVYFTQPHRTLADSTAYEVNGITRSFGVERNYVAIPKGTSIVRVTLEAPAPKAGENCSGVELMMLEGGNTLKGSESRAQLRVSNCNVADGSPILDPAKRTLSLTRTDPTPGIWDIHVFGQYQYLKSRYHLRVDYVVSDASVERIEATPSTLAGTFQWELKQASLAVQPDPAKSVFKLGSLRHEEKTRVAQDQKLIVGGPLGQLRLYPAEVQSVAITTGGSSGNDIDLDVLVCPASQTDASNLSACKVVAQSGTSTDVERVAFVPRHDMKYAVRVTGYDVKDAGNFVQGEELGFSDEIGQLSIAGAAPSFSIGYEFSAAQARSSALLNHPLFASGQYQAMGAIQLQSSDSTLLGAVPVLVRK